jgi:hypothetical protein
MPVILVTQEEEMRKIMFQNQPCKLFGKPYLKKKKKKPSQKRAGEVAQGIGLEFNFQI